MDEKEVQKKLEEINRKRDEHKAALAQCPILKNMEATPHPQSDTPLTEDEIIEQMKKWRETADPTCAACGICPIEK